MCMMLGEAQIHATNIFATRHGGKQVLVYEAALVTAGPNAMVLPIPVRDRESPVDLLDLSAHPQLFAWLKLYYHGPESPPGFGPVHSYGGAPPLPVLTVGVFTVSIVPSLADFGRLDARFHLQPGMQSLLGQRYGDWGFVVYQIAPGAQQLHPFGVAFESRHPRHLFFPTLHVHDGAHAPPEARFAHGIFAQGARLKARFPPYNEQSPETAPPGWNDVMHRPRVPPVGFVVPTPSSMPDFVDLHRPLDMTSRHGVYPNDDLFVEVAD